MYIQPSFVDSCSDHGEWSGGNGQYRGDRSVEVVPTYINGRPNVRAFSDEAIEARRGRKPSSVPLRSRILPQSARVDKLRSEAIELESAFKAGEFSAEEYTLLRSVAFRKLHRAEELLKKAIAPVQKAEETDEDSLEYTPSSGFSSQPNDGYASERYVDCGVEFIDELSSNNSFRKPLKIACTVLKTAVRWSQKAKSYWNELKAV
jgi:hypothetical protein